MMLLSTRIKEMRSLSTIIVANEVTKRKNNGQ